MANYGGGDGAILGGRPGFAGAQHILRALGRRGGRGVSPMNQPNLISLLLGGLGGGNMGNGPPQLIGPPVPGGNGAGGGIPPQLIGPPTPGGVGAGGGIPPQLIGPPDPVGGNNHRPPALIGPPAPAGGPLTLGLGTGGVGFNMPKPPSATELRGGLLQLLHPNIRGVFGKRLVGATPMRGGSVPQNNKRIAIPMSGPFHHNASVAQMRIDHIHNVQSNAGLMANRIAASRARGY